jgi:microcystin-dependent protein
VTVPGATDEVQVSREGGAAFATFAVHATTTQVHGSLSVQQELHGLGGLRVTGVTSLEGSLEVAGVVKLQQGTAINEFSSDGKLADNSDAAVPTERAVKEYIDNLLAGSVAAFATTTPPPDWLECNGQAISRTQYARLFARISTTFGQGDGATTFNVPDLRGLVIRGWDHGRGLDSGRSFGSLQGDAFQDHQHSFSGTDASIGGGSHSHVDHNGGFWENIKLSGGGNASIRQYVGFARTWAESHAHGYRPSGSVSNAITGSRASETRIKNLALMYCIKS